MELALKYQSRVFLDTITRHRRGYPKVIINVGGERHEIMWKLLEAKPLSRKVSYVYMYLYTWDVTCFDWIKKIRKKLGYHIKNFLVLSHIYDKRVGR